MEFLLYQKGLRGASSHVCAFFECLRGDLLDEMSYPPNNDFVRSVLINEGFSGNMVSYYEMAHDSDLITWANLLLFRKRRLGKNERTSFIGRRRYADDSWPVVFRQYLYNRSSTRSGQILPTLLKVFSKLVNFAHRSFAFGNFIYTMCLQL